MRMGCFISFRGRRRFVIGVRPNGLLLDRVNRNHLYGAPYVFYSVGEGEKSTLRVVKASTVRARARARNILEGSTQPWTTIEWDGDRPIYVHDPAQFPRQAV
jgi:hypothetical protein